MNQPKAVTVTIANNTAASNAFEIFGYQIAGVITPSAWTGADVSFEVDPNGAGTFYKVTGNTGALLKLTGIATNAAEYHIVAFGAGAPGPMGQDAKIVSSNTASEADVNQGAARTVIVQLIPIA